MASVLYGLTIAADALDLAAMAVERMPWWRRVLLGGPPLDAEWLRREARTAQRARMEALEAGGDG